MSASATGLRVQVGDQMPSVGLRATDGYLLNLRTFVTKQPAIFVFFGGPSLRGAAREHGDELARTLAAAVPRLEREGIALVGVTTDSERQQTQYVADLELPFLLFCDERRTAAMSLGVPTHEERGNINAEPTAFAVAQDGTILDIVERVESRGLIARLVEAIHPPE
jgi:thioredoxin-dependent peroxiredoxin